jgi:hypothetical protein
MHYSNLVIIERPDEGEALDEEYVTEAVSTAMGPHEEQGGFWDWYQVGGRWSGTLDDYDPETDPKNSETCDYCGGTGDRATFRKEDPALQHPSGCNACLGKGKRTTWPTQWGFRTGDVQPIDKITQEQYERFYRVVTPSGRKYDKERLEPWHEKIEDWTKPLAMPPLEWLKTEYPDHLVVVVDNHV